MLNTFLQIFLTIFIVIDPVGIVPLFISATGRMTEEQKKRTIWKAVGVAFIVLGVFILAGRFILSFFGISPGSFYVAGGTLFFLISIDMLFGQPKRTKTSKEEEEDDSSSVAVFPLAIPMIAGPGTITTLMLYSADAPSYLTITLLLFGAVILSLAGVTLAMFSSRLVLRVLGRTGVSVVERMMGLVLSGLAIQFVYDGLTKLGILG
ncbi:MAG: MarC family protein [Treponema sp.]|nr:MarC family protein [Treponema sp.]